MNDVRIARQRVDSHAMISSKVGGNHIGSEPVKGASRSLKQCSNSVILVGLHILTKTTSTALKYLLPYLLYMSNFNCVLMTTLCIKQDLGHIYDATVPV
jgi:hypothetical protein